MSISTRSGILSRASLTPSSPLTASMVWYPFACSTSRASFMFFSWSSMISTVLTGVSSLTYRQRDGESGPLARRALKADGAAVQLDEALGERQAEPRALGLLGVVAPDLLELLEHRGLVLGCDADAGVLDRDLDAGSVLPGRNRHAPAVGGELDRVGEQVEDDLLELALVGLECAEPLVDLERKRDAVALRPLAHPRHRVRQRARQVEARELEVHAPGLDLREIQDVVDQREEVAAGLVDVLQVVGLFL